MKIFPSLRSRARVAVFLFGLYAGTLPAQPNKEDRNYYPTPPKNKKVGVLVRQAPFVFSPYLSYKEQKTIQMGQKKAGGITFTVKTRRRSRASANYKQPHLQNTPRQIPGEIRIVDTIAPFVRYDLSDTTNR
ncbi:MAG: hypothetical protein U0X91_30895 [Spirosomataceae bacterium]